MAIVAKGFCLGHPRPRDQAGALEDREIQDYFIKTAFPPQAQAESVVALLEQAAAPMALHEILGQVNIRQGRLEAC